MNNAPAIVVIAYNRADCLQRLLLSLQNAEYTKHEIPLIISIDKSKDKQVLEVARNFMWKFGKKEIIEHTEHLGLKQHVFFCGDLSEQYENVILLEDDLLVSPFFYIYTITAVNFYKDSNSLAGIALYSYSCTENNYYPFVPLEDGSDTYFMQLPCSWGQVFNNNQWANFRKWYSVHKAVPYTDKLPAYLANNWTATSWKKHFADYLVNTEKYFVYPRIALSTNYGERGSHAIYRGAYQVPLLTATRNFRFKTFESASFKYDANFEIGADYIRQKIQIPAEEYFDVDLYGTKNLFEIKAPYLLSCKKCIRPISTFGNDLVGCVQNILMGSEGTFYSYGKTEDFVDEMPDAIEFYTTLNPLKEIILSSTIKSEALALAKEMFEDWRVPFIKDRAEEHNRFLRELGEEKERLINELSEERNRLINKLAEQKMQFELEFVDKYTEDFKLHQQFPRVQISILCMDNLSKLEITTESVRSQNYPDTQLVVKVFYPASIMADVKQEGNVESYIPFWDRQDLIYKFNAEMEHSDALYYCVLNAGDELANAGLVSVNRIFKKYPDVVWITGMYGIDNGDLALAKLRWNKHIFEMHSKMKSQVSLCKAFTFWTRYAWDCAKNEVALKSADDIPNSVWTALFNHHRLYVYEIPTTEAVQVIKKSSSVGKLVEDKWKDKFFEFWFLSNTAFLRSYYKMQQNLPPIIRYDSKSDLFYLSDY